VWSFAPQPLTATFEVKKRSSFLKKIKKFFLHISTSENKKSLPKSIDRRNEKKRPAILFGSESLLKNYDDI